MTEERKRSRRETADAPRGIGGMPPFPRHGPVTSLRVLGVDFDVSLDAHRSEFRLGRDEPPAVDVQLPFPSVSRSHALLTRCEHGLEVTDLKSKHGSGIAVASTSSYDGDYYLEARFFVRPGDRIRFGNVRLLALDAATTLLLPKLTTFCGPRDDVNRALTAALWNHMIVLCASKGDDVLDLARLLHAQSIRKDFPFTRVDSVPESDTAVDELCTRAGCGTVFLDLTRQFSVPARFVQHLLSDYYHLQTIVAASSASEVFERLGDMWEFPRRHSFEVCSLGFPQVARLAWSPASFSPTT